MINEVFHGVDNDPIAYEIRAAAFASSSNFNDAVKSERKALSLAKGLKWDLNPLNNRMARYAANQPRYGTLLPF